MRLNYKYLNATASTSLVIIVLLSLCFINPATTTDDSYAAEATKSNSATPSLAVSAPATAAFATLPNNPLRLQAISQIRIVGQNLSSYNIRIHAKDGDNYLRSHDKTNAAVIAPVTNIQMSKTDPNTWGYYLPKLGGTALNSLASPVPTDVSIPQGQTIDNLASAFDNTHNLALNAKIDETLPSGEYGGGIIISVVGQPNSKTISNITYMQEITPEVCAASAEHETTQLIDNRDNNKYWVTKMKDGNCWMTQNLALDITEERIKNQSINPTNSDLLEPYFVVDETVNWGLSPAPTTNWYNNARQLGKSYHFNQFVLSDPTSTSQLVCPNTQLSDLDNCSALTDISHQVAGSYDEHYLLGNFYNALAASGGGITDDYKVDQYSPSICPKQWFLPTVSTLNKTEKPSWRALLAQYISTSILDAPESQLFYAGSNLTSAPLYLARFGIIYDDHTGVAETDNFLNFGGDSAYMSGDLRAVDYDDDFNEIRYSMPQLTFKVSSFMLGIPSSTDWKLTYTGTIRCASPGL